MDKGVKKGHFSFPIGEDNITTGGDFIVVERSESEMGAGFGKLHETLSSEPSLVDPELLKVLEAIFVEEFGDK